MEWETQHKENVSSSQMTYRFNTKPIKLQQDFFFWGGGRSRQTNSKIYTESQKN